QEIPFQLLVDELKPDRVANRHPLFQVSLAFQNMPRVELELPELTMSRADDDQTSRFDLEIFLGERDGALAGSIAYDTRLFDAARIERLAEHWGNLLEAAVSAPDRAVADILLECPKRRVANPPQDAILPHTSFNESFARQVQATP